MTLTCDQEQDIINLRQTSFQTKRATVPALEEILYLAHPVLDHGFIRVIDYMGDDAAITQAARVSYGKGTKQVQDDRGLIRYLLKHAHTSPFEMCEIKLHIKMPIFVARQWIRHRTANVNEYSARYSILDKEFYIPAPEHLASQSETNNQGRGNILNADQAAQVLDLLKEDADRSYRSYQWLLNKDETGQELDPSRDGLARELARMTLSLNTYTQWYWKIDLHNLLHFLRLRAEAHAQYEIRVYADLLLGIIQKWVPLTHEAFQDYKMNAVTLSTHALNVVRLMINGEQPQQPDSGLSKREWAELMTIFHKNCV